MHLHTPIKTIYKLSKSPVITLTAKWFPFQIFKLYSFRLLDFLSPLGALLSLPLHMNHILNKYRKSELTTV